MPETECSLFVDDFTGEKKIVVTKVNGYETEWISLFSKFSQLRLSFVGTGLQLLIKLATWNPDLKMYKNDEIIMLFEDKSTINHILTTNGINGCITLKMTTDQLIKLASINLEKIRVSCQNGETQVFNFDVIKDSVILKSEYKTPKEGQELLKILAMKFGETVYKEFVTKSN